ncbi:hypothetical protein [Anaerotardibacter muris]|uniref:hypothetical protein n=1 Tax=Anaerotardibacter muris TaxID=2941505 RepID=UPI00203B4119|nr:hypothetical protein [Anaerotardibacter muris]
MKTATNIEKTTGKVGRTILAVLLISLTCVSPMTYNAFAEENEDPATTQVDETTSSTPIAQASTPEDTSASDAAATAAAAEAEANTEATAEDAEADEDATAEAEAEAEAPADEATTNIMAAAAEDTTDAAATESGNVINVSTPMEFMDAFKYDINSQSNQTFVINLDADISLAKPQADSHTLDTHGKRFFIGTDRLCVKNGNTVTILGHGHSLTYDDTSTTNLTLGTRNANLILGAQDGSDTLNITFVGSDHDIQSLVDVAGGTLTIHDGVTLSNNVNATGYPGGAISATGGAIVNMDGGLIQNNTNRYITWGGGVSVDGAEFHMTGGKITGNSEHGYGDYLGYGGGVSLGAHGGQSLFTMSGDAVIEGNSAPNGGGVYVGPNSTFEMSGHAAILNNTAETYGGGVYVAQGGTFTMGEDNVIAGNSAGHGGGVINFGTATVTNVYDNDATTAGADIYNNGTITMEDVKADWSLSREQATSDPNGTGSASGTPTDNQPDLPSISFMSLAAIPASTQAVALNPSNKTIDAWYYDGHRETGTTDEDGNAVVEHNRWNANADTDEVPQYLMNYAVTGQPTTEVMGLKAAHGAANATVPDDDGITVTWENEDGTVLFTMDDVDPADVPAAEEYNELSGNADPTEPDENGYSYDFEGWTKTTDGDNVIYIADYKAVPDTEDPNTPAVPTDPTNPTDPTDPTDPIDPDQPSYPADQPATHNDGDDGDEVAGPATPTKAADDSSDTTSEDADGTHAPSMGDDPAGLLLVMGGALGAAGLALRQARRAREL